MAEVSGYLYDNDGHLMKYSYQTQTAGSGRVAADNYYGVYSYGTHNWYQYGYHYGNGGNLWYAQTVATPVMWCG